MVGVKFMTIFTIWGLRIDEFNASPGIFKKKKKSFPGYNILLSISLRVQSKCGISSITSNLILFSFSKKKK